eukprot:XP_001696265.1 predicted protein [Chlamydomonas reinhardtii]
MRCDVGVYDANSTSTEQAAHFCAQTMPLAYVLAVIAEGVLALLPRAMLMSVEAMMGEDGEELDSMMGEMRLSVARHQTQPAAAAAIVEAAATKAALFRRLKTAGDDTDATGVTISNASCLVKVVESPQTVRERVKLKGTNPDLVLAPDQFVTLRVLITEPRDDKNRGKCITVKLKSLDVLDRAFEGGIRARFGSAFNMARDLQDGRPGSVTIANGKIDMLSVD